MKKTTLGLLSWAAIGVVVYFFGKTLIDNWHNIDSSTFHFNWLAVPGTLLLVLAVVTSGVLWGKILSGLESKRVSLSDSIRIHCASWLLKYVPGHVGSLINKLTWAKSRGISQKSTTTSFIYENVLTAFASFIMSLPLLAILDNTGSESTSLLLPLLLIIPALIIIYRPVFYRLLNFIFTKLGKKPFRDSDFLSTKQLGSYLALYLVPRLINGVGFVLIAASLLPIEPHMYIVLGSTYILASIIGLLAVVTPGGIGVREAVIVLFASLYFPIEQAIILSVVARLYATVADLGVMAVYLVLNKGRIKQI